MQVPTLTLTHTKRTTVYRRKSQGPTPIYSSKRRCKGCTVLLTLLRLNLQAAMSVPSRRSSYVLSLEPHTHTPYLSCIPREKVMQIYQLQEVRARIFKLLRESKNWFQGTYSAAGCVAWRASTTTLNSYSVPSPHRLFKNSCTGEYKGKGRWRVHRGR